ncbi:hypothetical protein NKT34_07900 [Paenibacillus polysaccharolyticus]|uniref:hypothetical protein n=2 Tax=Paenibacillus TaxID=44249 RepID=UPI0012B86B73|nr:MULTISPECIES: hypothetical protein [Paenibacillus]MCP1133208.1 hypothetical protein [Paenibacillus polysaccharolyticus]
MMNMYGVEHGPVYLQGLTKSVAAEKTHEVEWQGKLQTGDGHDQFHIFYYGDLDEDDLIMWHDMTPLLIYAEHSVTGERYLLIDAAKHGYDAMVCETYPEEELNNRPLRPYLDVEGEDTFEVFLTAYYNVPWDEEFGEDVEADGTYELITGERVHFNEVKRNGYDAFAIRIRNRKGVETEIVQEELA